MRRRWWQWTGGATKGVVSDGGRCVGMAAEPGEAGASAWAIGSIPHAYVGNICPPPNQT